MLIERHDETKVDRCSFCGGFWFDASELDRVLEADPAVVPVEAAIPERGRSAISCPRCWPKLLDAAGWSGMIFERCPTCRGLYVDAPELLRLQQQGPPESGAELEQVLHNALREAGWNLLAASGLIALLVRLLR
jgi:Zn-finger nucleic acid-binding protein